MGVEKQLEKMVANVGFLSVDEYLSKLALPVFGMTFLFAIGVFLFLPTLPVYVPVFIIISGMGFILLYPYLMYKKSATNIDENLHLMITYAGTLATADIQRNILFKRLSDAKRFGDISKITEKIFYFSKSWNLGFSKSARKIAEITPSKIFSDFLDRFAVMMDFGQDLKVFLAEEQDSMMDHFESQYKKALENIRLMQDVFVSLTIAIAFVMATALLLPVVAGISINFVVQVSLGIIVAVDIFLYIIVKSFIPADRLCHTMKEKDQEMKKVIRNFFVFAPISILFTLFLLYVDKLPFLFNFAIGFSPLLVVGFYAQNHEKLIYTRDKAFPSFVRALGSIIEVKVGAVISSLRSLQVHDFGVLNNMVISLYRRLRLGNNKYRSWALFAQESGSNLITNFTQIFTETIYLGGNAEKIGEIVSKNFSRLLSLRKLRLQLASSLRGAFYGSLVGFAAASYVSAKITEMLAMLFKSPISGISGSDSGYMASVVSSIAPPASMNFDFAQISMYIGIMVVVHCIVSSLVIKIVDGGNNYAAIFDLVFMLWIGAFISWLLPNVIDSMMPDLASNMNASAGNGTAPGGGG
ncbi:MAG: hypothetical protein ACQEP1_05785 [Nanobdellota archaeon]